MPMARVTTLLFVLLSSQIVILRAFQLIIQPRKHTISTNSRSYVSSDDVDNNNIDEDNKRESSDNNPTGVSVTTIPFSELEESSVAEYSAFANILADAAREEILPYWRRPINVENKAEEGRSVAQTLSPVTIADRAAEMAMRKRIEERYPTHGIYGEEYGSVRTDAEWVWVLDPIDGTKNFITGKPIFGTLISCLHNGIPVVGIIDQCILKERWVGALGFPTTLNGVQVKVDTTTTTTTTTTDNCVARRLSDATVFTTTPDMFRRGEEMTKFESIRASCKRMLYGCDCYAYALLASGFGPDAVVEADLGLYDYCALVPVVEGAGGIMTDWKGKRLTLHNHNSSEGRVIACSNNELHTDMLRILGMKLETVEKEATGTRSLVPKDSRTVQTLLLGIALGAILSNGLLTVLNVNGF